MMPKSKLLLGRGCPRSNIPRVEYQNEFLPCDKLLVRFMHEYPAYKFMRKWFLEHLEYSHLVLATDDIIVMPEHIEQLIRDIELLDYPVISGVMNVEQDDKFDLNIAWELPLKERRLRQYKWIKRDELPAKNCFKVAFSGFPLMAIRRDIVSRSSFNADRVFEGKPPDRGASLDLVFCYWCQEHDIPVYVDKRIMMYHKRNGGSMQIGIRAKKCYLWKPGQSVEKISNMTYAELK